MLHQMIQPTCMHEHNPALLHFPPNTVAERQLRDAVTCIGSFPKRIQLILAPRNRSSFHFKVQMCSDILETYGGAVASFSDKPLGDLTRIPLFITCSGSHSRHKPAGKGNMNRLEIGFSQFLTWGAEALSFQFPRYGMS
jgi:hypothetical protein